MDGSLNTHAKLICRLEGQEFKCIMYNIKLFWFLCEKDNKKCTVQSYVFQQTEYTSSHLIDTDAHEVTCTSDNTEYSKINYKSKVQHETFTNIYFP